MECCDSAVSVERGHAYMIRLNDVSFQYASGLGGVSEINLTVHEGECLVLTGPSGGGKTTLTRLLNGLAPSYNAGKLTWTSWGGNPKTHKSRYFRFFFG